MGPLDLADTSVGVEDADADTGHIVEALQGGLAGIAGGGGEDQDVLVLTLGGLGGGEQLGQHGKGHVLKCGGGAPEQLQDAEIAHGDGGGQVVGLKFAGIGIFDQGIHIGNIGQQGGQDHSGHVHGRALKAGFPVEGRDGLGHIQAAIGSQALQNGLGAVGLVQFTAGGMI